MLILKIVSPNGKATTGKLSLRALVNVQAGYRYELTDSLTGLVPDDLRLKRVGRKLVLHSESQATTLELANFFPPADNLPITASLSLPGAPETIGDQIALLRAEPVTDMLSADLTRISLGSDTLAQATTGFEAFDEPIQLAQANTSGGATTATDAAGASGGSAGAAGTAGTAGTAAAATAAGLSTGAMIALGAVAVGVAAGAGGGGGSSSSAPAAPAPDTAAPVVQSMATTGSTVVLTYNEALEAGVGKIPVAGNFAVTVNGVPNVVTGVTVAGTKVTLTLTTATVAGDAVNVTYSDPTAGNDAAAIQDLAGNDAAGFSTLKAADGYVRGAQIYIDTNNNGVADPSEALAGVLTDANGNFFLPAGAPVGVIMAVGGVNIDTGVPNTMLLKAPAGSTMVNPLTTLVQALVTGGASLATAKANVVTALGLTGGTDLTTYDPLAALAADGTDATALAVQKAAAQVATLASLAADSAAKDASTTTTSAAAVASVVSKLATEINTAVTNSATVDLTDNPTITRVITGAVDTANVATVTGTIDIATEQLKLAASATDISAAQSAALDTVVPTAPTGVTLTERSDQTKIITSDTGTKGDNLTNDSTPTVLVSLNVTATDGTAAVAGNTVQVFVGSSATASGMGQVSATDFANGYMYVTLTTPLSADGTHSLTAKVTDAAGKGSSASAAYALSLDTAPPTATPTVALSSDTGSSATDGITRVGTLVPGVGTGNTPEYSINGTTWTSSFTPVEGLNTVMVRPTDAAGNGGTPTAPFSFTLDTTSPAFTSLAAANFAESGTGTAYAVVASDSSQVASYALGGADAALFNFNTTTGVLTFKAAPNFEAPADTDANNIYNLTFTATDGAGNTTANAHAVAVTVTNVNETPTLTSGATANFAENGTGAAYTVTGTDPDSIASGFGTLTYGLDGPDALLFTINPNNGAVTFLNAPNREAPLDAGANNVYDITVTASDGTNTTAPQAVSVTVTNVNEAPTSAAVTATPAVKNQAYSFDAKAAGNFADVDTGDTLTYSATGLPAGLTINSTSGAITGIATTEALTNSVTVKATDLGGLNTSQTFNLAVVTAPVITGITSSVAQAKSGDALTLTATLSEAVTVDGGTPTLTFDVGGQLMTATYASGNNTNTLIFTATTSAGDDSTVTVSAFNLGGASITGNTSAQALVNPVGKVVSAFIIDNSVPAFTSAPTANFAESGTAAAYATAATDGTTLVYSKSGADADRFTINSSTGALTFATVPNFEAPTDVGADNVYNLTVTATDALGQAANHSVAITVTNVNEAPTLTTGNTGTVTENLPISTPVYVVAATDPDTTPGLSYSLGGTDASAFIINATSGEVTLKASADFEAKSSYAINVIATDNGGLTSSKAVTVSVTNINEAPVFSNGINFSVTVAENTPTGTVIYTAAAADPEAAALTYTLGGPGASSFAINATTGAVTLLASPDFETKTSYGVDIFANDGTNNSMQLGTVNITNVNEAPTVAVPLADALAGTGVQFFYPVFPGAFADVDVPDTLNYTATQVSGAALPTWLVFNATGPHASFSGIPDATGTLDIRVTAKDLGNLSVFEDFKITVSNNAAPTVAANTTGAVTADSAFSLNLASLFTDTDIQSYAITGGTLPTGLTLANGIISGTVSAANVAAPGAVSILATDSIGQTATTSLKLYVSEIGAIIPVKASLNGTTLIMDFLVDENKDPNGNGLESLNALLGFDSVKLDYLSASSFNGSLPAFGTPNESTNPGTVVMGVISLSPLTGHLAKVMSVSFNVAQPGDFRIDITPTDFDGVNLSAQATHAWFSTT